MVGGSTAAQVVADGLFKQRGEALFGEAADGFVHALLDEGLQIGAVAVGMGWLAWFVWLARIVAVVVAVRTSPCATAPAFVPIFVPIFVSTVVPIFVSTVVPIVAVASIASIRSAPVATGCVTVPVMVVPSSMVTTLWLGGVGGGLVTTTEAVGSGDAALMVGHPWRAVGTGPAVVVVWGGLTAILVAARAGAVRFGRTRLGAAQAGLGLAEPAFELTDAVEQGVAFVVVHDVLLDGEYIERLAEVGSASEGGEDVRRVPRPRAQAQAPEAS